MAYEYTRENNLYEDSCFLVSKINYVDENGVKHTNEQTDREVYCMVGSIYQKEFYEAYQAGITAQYRLTIVASDYNNEVIVKYRDVYYTVYRRYPTGDYIELYLRNDANTLKG